MRPLGSLGSLGREKKWAMRSSKAGKMCAQKWCNIIYRLYSVHHIYIYIHTHTIRIATVQRRIHIGTMKRMNTIEPVIYHTVRAVWPEIPVISQKVTLFMVSYHTTDNYIKKNL